MEKSYYNMLDVIYRNTLNYGVDNNGYNIFIDQLKKDHSYHSLNKIKQILVRAKNENKLVSDIIFTDNGSLKDKINVFSDLEINKKSNDLIKTFSIEKMRSCGKYSFNGGIILYDTEKNKWCNKTHNIDKCVIYNISRSCNNDKNTKNCIKYKTINLYGDMLTISKNIFNDGSREDPRVFIIDDNLYISYSFLYFYPDNRIKAIKIKYCQLSNFKPYDEIHLDIGNNSIHKIHKKSFYEKNWLFGQLNGIRYLIYTLFPLVIYDLGKKEEIINCNWLHRLKHKFNIRAGAPGVIVDNKLWIWGHTHEDIPDSNYYPILIVLDKNLKMYAYTDPIIIDKKIRIIYPVGAVFLENEMKWIISCGYEDREQILIHIQHQTILNNLILN